MTHPNKPAPREFWIDCKYEAWESPPSDRPERSTYGLTHVIEMSAYEELRAELIKYKALFGSENAQLKARVERLREVLGMLDHIGVSEPYNKIVRDTLAADDKGEVE